MREVAGRKSDALAFVKEVVCGRTNRTLKRAHLREQTRGLKGGSKSVTQASRGRKNEKGRAKRRAEEEREREVAVRLSVVPFDHRPATTSHEPTIYRFMEFIL